MPQRRTVLTGAAALLAALGLGSPARAQPGSDQPLAGEWTGVLQVGSVRLRLRLTIGADGSAVLYSLDQGAAPIPASNAVVTADRVDLTFAAIGGRYQGRLEEGALIGTFTQGGPLPLRFERGEGGLTAVRPPPAPLTAERLSALLAASSAPGIAAAAHGRDGRRLALTAGVRQHGAGAPIGLDDAWHLGSITKSMTATLVAKLAEDGLLAWDAPLSALLDGVPMRDEYRAVTLRHLLSHRSGLPANLPIPRLLAFPREEADPRAGREAYVVEALAMAPHGPAETSFEYSNNGYVIAGAVIERVTGRPWEAVIRDQLFAPLGMARAGFGAPGTAGALDQPVGHSRGLFGVASHPPGSAMTDNPAVLGPAGRVHAPFEDLLRFAEAHRDRNAFLRPESWALLQTPPFGGDYALGLVVRPDGALWHNGSNTLWYAEMLIHPDRGIVAAAAANTGALNAAAPAVGEALMGAAAAVVSP